MFFARTTHQYECQLQQVKEVRDTPYRECDGLYMDGHYSASSFVATFSSRALGVSEFFIANVEQFLIKIHC